VNVAEAEKVILFPLQDYLEHRELKYFPVKTTTGLLNVPCFLHEGEVVWGATAMILSEFLDLIRKQQFTTSQ
jgi:hypothetical protein